MAVAQAAILSSMRTIVSNNDKVTLPASIRHRDGVKRGQEFDIERIARGHYLLSRRETVHRSGLTDWRLACPVKNFFVCIRSESPDTFGCAPEK